MSDLIESVHRANAELCAFQMRWDIDGDYIRCRKCKQPQLSTYANEAFMHAEKCRNDPVRDVHPWVTYLELLAPIAAHLNVAAWKTRHDTGDADHSPDAGKMGEEWRTIESAPEGQLLVVCWRDEEDTEHPDRYEFDYLEDGVWQKHSDDYEHFCAVAPAGSRGPSEQAPYIGWRPLPAARAGERG